MKTKYFISLAAAMLFMLTSLATQAQDVYEYATVTHYSFNIYVSYSTGEYKEIPISKEDAKPNTVWNNSSVLKLIAAMGKEGWEVVSAGSNGQDLDGGWRYFLKRKVK